MNSSLPTNAGEVDGVGGPLLLVIPAYIGGLPMMRVNEDSSKVLRKRFIGTPLMLKVKQGDKSLSINESYFVSFRKFDKCTNSRTMLCPAFPVP